ncbi:cupin domain-containing protein [Burkholderia glumae]|nr:cupin domain-containing protein [Burkholderia glumae]
MSGAATAVIGDEEFAIGQGDFVGYRKGGLPHSIRNTGSETLRCIVVGERLPHDVCDYPRQNKRMFRNPGMPWNLVHLSEIEELGGGVGKK